VNWVKARPLSFIELFHYLAFLFFFHFSLFLSLRSNFSKPFALIKCSGRWIISLISRPHRRSRGTWKILELENIAQRMC
jgi:hypothetical protein